MLQIVFRQICETCGDGGSFWSDLFVAILGGLLGTGTALLVFYLTNRYQVKMDELKKLEVQNNKLYYLSSLLKSALSISKSQRDNMKDFVDEIQKKPLYVPAMPYVPMYDIQRIVEALNLEDYFLSYTLKYGNTIDKVREYKAIISSLDFLYANFNQVVDQLAKAKSFDHERKILFSRGTDEIDEVFGRIRFSMSRHGSPIEKEVEQAYEEFTKNQSDRYDIQYYHDNFVEPMFQIFSAYLSDPNNRVSEDIMSFFAKLRNLKGLFEYMQSNNSVFAEDLLDQITPIETQIESLEKNAASLLQMMEPSKEKK